MKFNFDRLSGEITDFNPKRRYVFTGYSKDIMGGVRKVDYYEEHSGKEILFIDSELLWKAHLEEPYDPEEFNSEIGTIEKCVFSWQCIDDTKRLNYIDRRKKLRRRM